MRVRYIGPFVARFGFLLLVTTMAAGCAASLGETVHDADARPARYDVDRRERALAAGYILQERNRSDRPRISSRLPEPGSRHWCRR